MKLTHLTPEEHERIAKLLSQAQDAIHLATQVVKRAPYTDRALAVSRALQEDLIDPLHEAWSEEVVEQNNPYPSIAYAGPRPSRRKA